MENTAIVVVSYTEERKGSPSLCLLINFLQIISSFFGSRPSTEYQSRLKIIGAGGWDKGFRKKILNTGFRAVLQLRVTALPIQLYLCHIHLVGFSAHDHLTALQPGPVPTWQHTYCPFPGESHRAIKLAAGPFV